MRGIIPVTLALTLCSSLSLAQQPAPATQGHLELPVVMQQKIIAGVTPVGTPIQAKLVIATLVDGVVIPRNALLLGRVEQSVKKTKDTPSRLKIKIDSARWKQGSAPLSVYFTGCYYPANGTTRDSGAGSNQIHGSVTIASGGPNPRYYPPGRDASERAPTDMGPEVPEAPSPQISSHWVREDGADVAPEADGSVAVTSQTHDLKLDKSTTYLLTDIVPAPGH